MNSLRRFLSSWRNLLTAVIALLVYLLLPVAIRWYDPTAGMFDAGYLQWVGLATFVTFWAGFVGWVLWQLLFATLDKATAGTLGEWINLERWFSEMSSAQKWWACQGTFAFCVALFYLALKLIPVS